MPTSTSPRRSRLPRAERERQVLDIAHVRFAERGFGAVTMEDVAAEAGVTKPLLYAYFGNKDRLYLACMERAGGALVAAIAAEVAEASDSPEALRRGVRAFFAFVDADRDAWRVLFDETLPAGGEIATRAAEYRDRLVTLVAQPLLERVPPRGRGRAATEIEALAHALLGAAESLARWWLRTGAIPASEAADLLIATVEPGLRQIWPTGARAKEPSPHGPAGTATPGPAGATPRDPTDPASPTGATT